MILFLPIKDDAILQTAWNVGTFATYVSIDDAQEISISFAKYEIMQISKLGNKSICKTRSLYMYISDWYKTVDIHH